MQYAEIGKIGRYYKYMLVNESQNKFGIVSKRCKRCADNIRSNNSRCDYIIIVYYFYLMKSVLLLEVGNFLHLRTASLPLTIP